MTDLRGHIAEVVSQRGLTLATLERIADDVGVPQGSRATDAQLAQILARVYQPAGEPKSPGRTGGGDGSSDQSPPQTTPQSEGTADSSASEAATPAEAAAALSQSAAPNDLMDDILNVTGGELIPPKPRTPEFAALPSEEKLAARVYWQEHAA